MRMNQYDVLGNYVKQKYQSNIDAWTRKTVRAVSLYRAYYTLMHLW